VKRFIIGLIAIGIAWSVGFAAFLRALPAPEASAVDKADGVVVFTGGGGARITAAMNIFAGGAGERLLISGVNPETSKAQLYDLWVGAPQMFQCCVDLGRKARSTEGNAAEAAEWANANKFRHMILVTSDYHMPRAIVVTKARMPGADITPYAVRSGALGESGWPVSFGAGRRLAGEYGKYVVARVKAKFASAGA